MTQSQSTDPSHKLESSVKSYVRSFPFVGTTAKGAIITAEDGTDYLDFLSGAGTLNYGHNNDHIKDALIDYIQQDGIIHGLDMATKAKNHFIETFDQTILKPRNLDYRLQFCGPTGTNAVEAAIKLARKVTGRLNIFSFTNGFHGMTQGALAVTGNNYHKEGIPGTYSHHTTFMPYCDYSKNVDDSIAYIRQHLNDNSSGVNLPAAMILECVQGEGGVNVASPRWLRGIRKLCDEFGIILIVDDIQMGCGRTGDFFSFEESGITPDIVLLSKSIGAYGLPMALVLIKPELDTWKPAQHNGTFRGHNLAFVAATHALNHYWSNDSFSKDVKRKSKIMEESLQTIARRYPELDFDVRGRGLVWAMESKKIPELAETIQKICFEHHMIIETCGSKDQALKPLPALVITDEELQQGLSIIEAAYDRAIKEMRSRDNIVSLAEAS
jgi:diaminobutyrate-2-oxoglutarate transaminase